MRETKKAVKIISELMIYYSDMGASDLSINYHTEKANTENEFEIVISGVVKNLTSENLTELREHLNTERETQVEEYYWELAGEGNSSREMSLVGMLIDKAVVEYKNNNLKITIWRQD
ncbi:MAG: hypothetical protein ACQEQG_01250 [Bacillota bacterium]